MNVLYHQAAGPALQRRLADLQRQGLTVHCCAEHDAAGLQALLPETEVLWHCLRPVDAALIAAAPRLRLIQKIGVGVNTIDLEAARASGVAVCNMPGTNAVAVAESALALMLAVLRQVPAFDALTRAGQGWDFSPQRQDRLGELNGRCVGLVGYGGVPRVLAPILTAMGARVIYTATAPKADVGHPYCTLTELLQAADVVSLHAPLDASTEGLIGAAELEMLGPGGVLINTARGGLVDSQALYRALQQRSIAGAGLDVFDPEPIDPAEPLLSLDNVVLAPHVAWLTQETLQRSVAVAAENCRRLAAGEALLHRIV